MTRAQRFRRLALAGAIAATSLTRPLPGAAVAPDAASATLAVLADDSELVSDVGRRQRREIELLGAGAEQAPVAITVDNPLDGTIVPPDMVAPTLLWHDTAVGADRWLVDVTFDGVPGRIRAVVAGAAPAVGQIDERCVAVTNEPPALTPYQASAIAWRPGAALWREIVRLGLGRRARLTLIGFATDRPEVALSRGTSTISVSSDPVGAPIFYRDVPLMPSANKDGVIKPLDQSSLPLIAWRLKDVGRDGSRALLTDMPTCANCHSFSRDGRTLGMDVDGPDGDKGAYALAPIRREVRIDNEQIFTWNAYDKRPDNRITFGLLSRVSPDGEHVVSTINESLYVRNFPDYRFLQVFFPTRGILAVYTRATRDIEALPGADDPEFVHCSPVWTPDGQTIVFARAVARDPYEPGAPVATYAGDPNETQVRFELYRIPFNDGRGGTPEPIPGASANGMSNSFPKISPDGKWLVWVKSRNGMLMRPDGELWIMPLAGGPARRMSCNTPLMNSWHSFSPNGRWMVFSSKANRPYTQMFLTHIDEQGHDSPPILVEGATAANRAVNIPEFVNIDYDEFLRIDVPAVDHYESFARGNALVREGRPAEAVEQFEDALSDSAPWRINDWRIHDSMSKALLAQGDTERAQRHLEASLRINPSNAEARANLGYVLFQRGELARAATELDTALRLNSRSAETWHMRATLRSTLGDADGALADYDEAIRLDPRLAAAWSGRGLIRSGRGDDDAAIGDFTEAIRLDPDDPAPWYFRAALRLRRGDAAGARTDALRAREASMPGSPQAREIDALIERIEP